ncbi:aminoglycoside adenylyltransferase domain-containing protein [Paenibacillus sediminis]|uniref:DUF4111 domain-containing protein n=1 Tax=Paenibacillus sediminis TaxID=664909 RepID=A0ABS4H1W1_9BACL|nr:aminoglycoside adenylyltransferase domain-containing protein [Paenibacillus sediminis]MBP1936519.1 hypothetical protein [Paenibacillus sediminis]
MEVNLHPRINHIIDTYLSKVNQVKPGLIKGFYLYGSIALGDYSLELSDIDFITVTDERLHEEDLVILEGIHQEIERTHKKPNMNGIYLTWSELGKLSDSIQPFPYYMDGVMHRAGYFELNLVTWYELKHHGIRFVGPEIEQLDLNVDMELFYANMHENLNAYWAGWIDRASRVLSPYSYSAYFRRQDMEWGVLGITRLFYTFRERKITSKRLAGEYALTVVPERWHKIIQESINVRRGVRRSLYVSRMKRKSDALGYMRYILEQCNQTIHKQQEEDTRK